MLNVITHRPSVNLENCELTYVLDAEPIDYNKALLQHRHYCQMLKRCGAKVTVLKDNPELPDSVFVEDPIVVFDELAIVTSIGVSSRREEIPVLKRYFEPLRPLYSIQLPAKLEGGDVLTIGRNVYVGQSSRSNYQGYLQLKQILEPFGYHLIPMAVTGCLHLKTAVCALDEETVLLNPRWIDTTPFTSYKIIEVVTTEPFASNVMPINDTICMNGQNTQMVERVSQLGYQVETVDISEFVKAEAGLTCMSVRFEL